MNRKVLLGILAISILLLAGCTSSGRSRSSDYEQLDQEPDVCSSYERNRYMSTAEREWQDEMDAYQDALDDWLDDHNTTSGFPLDEPAAFSEPSGFDVTTHILVYEGPGTKTLYRNLTFNIVMRRIDEGTTETVTTEDAKASLQVFHNFNSLNELEVQVTPIVDTSEFIPKTYTVRKFVPCDDDPWFIKIPYSLKQNDTLEELDVPAITLYAEQGKITKVNPYPAGANETITIEFELKKSGDLITIEYDRDEIKYIEILDENDDEVQKVSRPVEEDLFQTGNSEPAYGPVPSGKYLLVLHTDEQPTTRIEMKVYDKDEVILGGIIYFEAKEVQITRDWLENEDSRTVVALVLIIGVLLLYGRQITNGGRK